MTFLSQDEKGFAFIISFAIGAAIVTASFWILRCLFSIYTTKSISLGYQALPSFHLNVMWLPGGLSGLVWSIGNFGSILAVSNLGQAIGLSLGQAAMIVSGLWGIFWYKEIVDSRKIMLWFMSAIVTCLSITALCYEHIE